MKTDQTAPILSEKGCVLLVRNFRLADEAASGNLPVMNSPTISIPETRHLAWAGVVFGALTSAAGGVWLISTSLAGSGFAAFADPVGWLAGLDSTAAFDALSNAAEIVAAVLAIAITVVAIVVELAATRYSHLITRLFIREPVNLLVLGLFVVTTLQCVWTVGTVGNSPAEAILPQAGFAITMVLVTLSLLVLLPYIYFVFGFLSPISIISRIGRDALRAVRKLNHSDIDRSQCEVRDAIEELQDVCRGAIAGGDRGIAMAGVSAVTSLIYDYHTLKHSLPPAWFLVGPTIAQDGDFVALGEEARRNISQRKIWLETKVFRQLTALMLLCAGSSRDIANLISINTQCIARDIGVADRELLQLCIRAFNSYLRNMIRERDAGAAYYIMDQYRGLAEHLLDRNQSDVAIQLAGYLRDYGQLAHRLGIPFLLEAAGHDVMQLIVHALSANPDSVDNLLTVLLALDEEIKEESEEDSLLGVRRSQIQLATRFMQRNDTVRTQRIVDDLKDERMERLERLRIGMLNDDRHEYWELSDRGGNFAYLDPELRPFLEPLFVLLRVQP